MRHAVASERRGHPRPREGERVRRRQVPRHRDARNGGRGRSERSERSPLRGKLLPLRSSAHKNRRGRPFLVDLFFAVRKGLEPSTSGVTGRHSNQLNYRTSRMLLSVFPKADTKVRIFLLPPNFFRNFVLFPPDFLSRLLGVGTGRAEIEAEISLNVFYYQRVINGNRWQHRYSGGAGQ